MKFSLYIVSHRGRRYRILRPKLVGFLVDQGDNWGGFVAGLAKGSICDLAAAWSLAARSPGTIIYLPISHRAQKPSCATLPREEETPTLDLVLSHHSLQLRPAEWKSLRHNLGTGHPISIPVETRRDRDHASHSITKLDRPVLTVRSRTLLVTGSRISFEEDQPVLDDLAEHGPAEAILHPLIRPSASFLERRVFLELIPT